MSHVSPRRRQDEQFAEGDSSVRVHVVWSALKVNTLSTFESDMPLVECVVSRDARNI